MKRVIGIILALGLLLAVIPTAQVSAAPEIVAGGYEIDMEDIPKVYFEDHPEWTELYDAAWNFHKGNIRKATTALNPEDVYYVDEAFDNTIFQWDTLFMMLFDKYGAHQFPALQAMDNFYYHQWDRNDDSDGYICRRINESNGNLSYNNYLTVDAINPPLFGWAEWEQYQIHGDVTRFTKQINGKPIIDRLASYFQFIKRTRTYDSGPAQGLYVSNGQGNGLDNTPNQDWDGWGQAANDMSLQQVQAADYIAKIAAEIAAKNTSLSGADKAKYESMAALYESERDGLTALVQQKLWSQQGGFFFNINSDTGAHTNIVTPTGLWSLAAGVATDEQAQRMIKTYALSSEKMFRPGGLSTVAYDYSSFKPTGGYWNGAMWSPTSFQWIKGLGEYGHDQLAFEEAVRHINMLYDVYYQGAYDRNGQFLHTIWENYSSEYILPGSTENSDTQPSRINFVGWTGALAIAGMLEDVVGLKLDAPNNEISWNLNLTEKHGVSNLYMNDADSGVNRVSLMAERRVSQTSPVSITVECDKAFTLKVRHNGIVESIAVAAGNHTYTLAGSDGAAPYLDIAGRQAAGLSAENFENAKDYVYFTGQSNSAVIDGLKNQVQKSDLIYNVNTVGYRYNSSANPAMLRDNEELAALGFENAKDYVKASHVHGDEGFMLMTPAGTQAQTLKVIVGVRNADAVMQASLSDASAARVTQSLTGGDEERVYVVEIPYRAASDGKNILVKFVIENEHENKDGDIALKGILLEDSGARIPAEPENVSLVSGGGQLTVSAQPPEGQSYDSYKIYVGTSLSEMTDVREAQSLPFVVDGLENYKKYYVAVSGIKDGTESGLSDTLSEIPEDTPRTDKQRAYADWQAALSDILAENPNFDNITSSLNFDITGRIYDSRFEFTVSTAGQEQGIQQNGGVVCPVLPQNDITVDIFAKITCGDETITVYQKAVVKAKDVNELPYVKGQKGAVSGTVNLTEEGGKDWLQINQNSISSYARKNIPEPFIKNLSAITGTGGTASDAAFSFTATDAVPGSDPRNRFGILARGLGGGFTFDLPYSEKMQSLKVYASVWGGDAALEILVNGAVMYSDYYGKDTSNGMVGQCFEVSYKMPSPDYKVSARLVCTLNRDTQWGGCSNVIQAVTLKETDEEIPPPEVEIIDEKLNITVSDTQPSRVNLTEEGTRDWLLFNTTNLAQTERKASANVINNIAPLIAVTKMNPNAGTATFSYTDGTIQPSGSHNLGIVFEGANYGISFDIPYSAGAQQLKLYFGAWSAKVAVKADVMQGVTIIKPVSDVFDTGAQASGTPAKYGMATVNYQLENPDQSLRITLVTEVMHDARWGNFSICAVSLGGFFEVSTDENLTGGYIAAAPSKVKNGETVDVFAFPDEGYELKEDSLKYYIGDTAYPIADAAFAMPSSDVRVTGEFVRIPTDKTALAQALEEAAKYPAEYYTAESFVLLSDAVTAGNAVLADDEALQAAIDAAVEAIYDAIAGLEYDLAKMVYYEESDEHLTFSAGWGKRAQIGRFSGHIAMQASKLGESMSFKFKGSYFEILSYKSYSQGMFDIYVDGEKMNEEPYDLYQLGSDAAFKQVVAETELPYGEHTVTLVIVGRNPSSIGNNVYVDAVGIIGEFIESTDKLVDDEALVITDQPMSINVMTNDDIPADTAITEFTQPESGSVKFENGMFVFTPEKMDLSDDEFTYSYGGETA
ncbi:MAG TPA: hypothetical protein DEQ02_01055, partial [Ruminococcaceae bacterium]|nr:hypothetical protein [Oscillospiraceae bacterium]